MGNSSSCCLPYGRKRVEQEQQEAQQKLDDTIKLISGLKEKYNTMIENLYAECKELMNKSKQYVVENSRDQAKFELKKVVAIKKKRETLEKAYFKFEELDKLTTDAWANLDLVSAMKTVNQALEGLKKVKEDEDEILAKYNELKEDADSSILDIDDVDDSELDYLNEELFDQSSDGIQTLLNGTLREFIEKELTQTAIDFFVSAYRTVYILHPVTNDRYATFADVQKNFNETLPNLVTGLFQSMEKKLKVETAFLGDNSMEIVKEELSKFLTSWMKESVLEHIYSGLQHSMDSICSSKSHDIYLDLNSGLRPASDILNSAVENIGSSMKTEFKNQWEKQRNDPNTTVLFNDGFKKMVASINNALQQDAPSVTSVLSTAPVVPSSSPVPTIPASSSSPVVRSTSTISSSSPTTERVIELPNVPEGLPTVPIEIRTHVHPLNPTALHDYHVCYIKDYLY